MVLLEKNKSTVNSEDKCVGNLAEGAWQFGVKVCWAFFEKMFDGFYQPAGCGVT